MSADDYVELLPVAWRVINAYGIKISRRVYDGGELNPFRRQPSGVRARKDLWEIRHDPYDISRIWVRNHWEGGWITVFWRHLHSVPAPFGEMAWDHARKQLNGKGRQATEEEIAAAAAALMATVSRGPAPAGTEPRKGTRKSRRAAARARAAGQPSWPRPGPATPPAERGGTGQDLSGKEIADGEGDMADVVPLGIFDAREEASRWW